MFSCLPTIHSIIFNEMHSVGGCLFASLQFSPFLLYIDFTSLMTYSSDKKNITVIIKKFEMSVLSPFSVTSLSLLDAYLHLFSLRNFFLSRCFSLEVKFKKNTERIGCFTIFLLLSTSSFSKILEARFCCCIDYLFCYFNFFKLFFHEIICMKDKTLYLIG